VAGTEYEILMETYAGHYYPESPDGGCATGPVLPGAYQDPLEFGSSLSNSCLKVSASIHS